MGPAVREERFICHVREGSASKEVEFFFLSKLYVPLECTHSMRTHVLKAKFGNVSEVCVPQECTHSIVTHRCL